MGEIHDLVTLQKNHINFYIERKKRNRLFCCSVKIRNDRTWTRNRENCTDSKYIFGGRYRLTNELGVDGEGKGAIKNTLKFWLK